MPVVVNTELGSGLPETRGFKAVEPGDVAGAIVEALQTGRFEVYVPKSVSGIVRFGALMPRRTMDFFGRALKGDQVLARPDHVARAAYEGRMAETVERAQVAAERARAAAAQARSAAEDAQAAADETSAEVQAMAGNAESDQTPEEAPAVAN
jgi:hypothetical protein